MKYYTSAIPYPLAEKLKEKGMPMEMTIHTLDSFVVLEDSAYAWLDEELGQKPEKVEKYYAKPKYCEVFDWLTERGIYVGITRTFARWGWLLFQDHAICQEHYETWHEAAEKAIEKALTLI